MSTGLWTGSTGVGSRVHGFIKRRSLATDPTVEVAGFGRGRRGLALAAARHDRAQRLTGVRIFSSYGSRFSMIFAPTGSQQRGELDYANLNRQRAATEPGNDEAARPELGHGEGGLR
jgi:hypothetical protein